MAKPAKLIIQIQFQFIFIPCEKSKKGGVRDAEYPLHPHLLDSPSNLKHKVCFTLVSYHLFLPANEFYIAENLDQLRLASLLIRFSFKMAETLLQIFEEFKK